MFETVRNEVTAKQIAEYYGIRVGKNGMACCPFHKDKHPSMKLDKRFYCFGCGEKGDAVDFVAKYYALGLKDAAIKICSDFGIEYYFIKAKTNKKRKSVKPIKTEKQIFEETLKWYFHVLTDYLHQLIKWKTEYEPKLTDENWHPYFIEALRETSFVEYLIDILLEGSIHDRAFLITDCERKVIEIEGKLRKLNEC